MARWAVIRVAAVDGMTVQERLVAAFAPVTMRIDTRPPASGPEWEIAVQDHSESEVWRVIGSINVLASKTTLEEAYAP